MKAMGSHFDYSETEWSAIEAAVREVRVGPLTSHERRRFRSAGDLYRVHSRSKVHLDRLSNTRSKAWILVEKLSEELRAALEEAAKSVTREEYLERFPSLLVKLRDDAQLFSRGHWEMTKDRPQEIFYRTVLSIWVDEIGGKLKKSRSSDTAEPTGPLLRFFMAVTYPVMGSASPKPETIHGIIKREKALRKAEKAD